MTGGHPPFQREKMEKAGLDTSIFSKIAIPEDSVKKPFYEGLANEFSIKSSKIWVCGDRVDMDLAPAYELGINTIHMRWGRGKMVKSADWIDHSISISFGIERNYTMTTANQITPGMTLNIDGKIFRVESSVKVTVAKGNPFVKTKLRNLVTEEVIERNFKLDQMIQEVSLIERTLEFLYPEGKEYLFLDIGNLEQCPRSFFDLGRKGPLS